MRWIFITLVTVNLAVFAWSMVTGSGGPVPSQPKPLKNPYSQYPELALLSELDEPLPAIGAVDLVGGDHVDGVADIAEVGESSTEPLLAEPSEVVSLVELEDAVVEGRVEEALSLPRHKDKLLCELVGPFESSDVAGDFIARLKAIEVVSSVRDLELPAGLGYWVYIEPLASRREALRMLGELQAKRIDSYVIPRGELVNGISLGMFSKKRLSDARVKEMAAIGLDPKVEEIERSYREIWVMLNPGEDAKMSKLSWERATEGIKALQRRQNYCLDVASE